MPSFFQTSILLASDYKKHYFKLTACQELYDTSIQDKLISVQMIFVCVCCATEKTDEKNELFFMKNADAVLRNQLKSATEGDVQMKPIMFTQTNTDSTSKQNTENPMITAYDLSLYNRV